MWLNRRSSENSPIRIRFGGSFKGRGGRRSISITILTLLANREFRCHSDLPPILTLPGLIMVMEALHALPTRIVYPPRTDVRAGRNRAGVLQAAEQYVQSTTGSAHLNLGGRSRTAEPAAPKYP